MIRRPEEVARAERAPLVSRVALLSVHTCPLDQPGNGDSGGMNVYVRAVARRLAEMGVAVDIFTRRTRRVPKIRHMAPGVRVVHLEAGPLEPVAKESLEEHLPAFLYALLRFEREEAAREGLEDSVYDVVHSHYWLSGWAGIHAAARWKVPLVHSFHTLGRVKNRTRAAPEPPETPGRIHAEDRIVQAADCILAPAPAEARELVELYGAAPDRVRVVSPGVDTELFRPDGGRARLGCGGTKVLFVGRLQPLKGPDVAVRALGHLRGQAPELGATLTIVGGPSGRAGIAPEELRALAAELGLGDVVSIHGPVPHERLPAFYRAADAVVVPSLSESFGLVALEASACGTPVVATDVGGLRTAVRDGHTGLLVPRDEPAIAGALAELLGGEGGRRMGEAGVSYARRFDWRHSAAGLLDVYEEQAGLQARLA